MVAMTALRGMCEKIGFSNPQTLLQSGNLVFQCTDLEGEALEQRLDEQPSDPPSLSVDHQDAG